MSVAYLVAGAVPVAADCFHCGLPLRVRSEKCEVQIERQGPAHVLPAASARAMEILYLLTPLSVALVFAIGALFWWALASGQFDDLEGPAHRVVMDDGPPHDRQRGEA